MINKAELHRLKPEDRIKRLKQLEEENKKEVIEIEKLIKEAGKEIRIEKIAEDNMPHPAAVDITRLFEAEGESLERAVKKEAPESSQNSGYSALTQAYEDYYQLKRAVNYAASGALNEGHMEA